MSRYEDQPADVLLRDLFDLGKKAAWTVDDQMEYDEDIAAIKVAIVREASVGTLTKTMRQKGSIEWNLPSKRFHEGVYDIIPREGKP